MTNVKEKKITTMSALKVFTLTNEKKEENQQTKVKVG